MHCHMVFMQLFFSLINSRMNIVSLSLLSLLSIRIMKTDEHHKNSFIIIVIVIMKMALSPLYLIDAIHVQYKECDHIILFMVKAEKPTLGFRFVYQNN